jgi:hypothetical protein
MTKAEWERAARENAAIKAELNELNERYTLADDRDYEWAIPCVEGLQRITELVDDALLSALYGEA